MLGGAFGRCYRVCEVGSPGAAEWACKILNKADMKSVKIQERLRYEIRVMRALPPHPNVVQYRHSFEDNERVYIVMELCSKETLQSLLKKRIRLTEFEGRYFARQLVDGIAAMHKCKLIHRDIKFANILLDHKNRVKIADFGLSAKLQNDEERKKSFLGTPNFLAPEIISRSENGHSYEVDVWAIGIVLYTMLVGRTPFRIEGKQFRAEQLYSKICNDHIMFPPEYQLSNEVQHLILSLCSKDVTMRPSCREILAHAWFNNHSFHTPIEFPPDIFTTPIGSYEELLKVNTTQSLRPHRKHQHFAKSSSSALSEKNLNIKKHTTQSTKNLASNTSSRMEPGQENMVQNSRPTRTRSSTALEARLMAVNNNITNKEQISKASPIRTLRSRKIYKDPMPKAENRQKQQQQPQVATAPPTPPQSSSPTPPEPEIEASPLIPAPIREKSLPSISYKSVTVNAQVQQPSTKSQNVQESLIKGMVSQKGPRSTARPVDSKATVEHIPLLEAWETRLEYFLELIKEGQKGNCGSFSESCHTNPPPPPVPVYLKQWITTEKYGTGYLLSNNTYGFCFRDGTMLSHDSDTKVASYIRLKGDQTRTFTFEGQNVPESLRKKWIILDQTQDAFKKNHTKTSFGSPLNSSISSTTKSNATTARDKNSLPVYLVNILRSSSANIFRLSNSVVQIHFIDSSKILLFGDHHIYFVSKVGAFSQYDATIDHERIVHDGINTHKHFLNRLNYIVDTLSKVKTNAPIPSSS
ncbi:Cell cycle serine/threonine-protein kinase cdc5/MSD2 [Mycoemilia scoparia]|uniref:Cell cycle serine/threonine-protein kinase cdc5/MSD2 n=1 Tax=Mycoemilia scoparia TaxID=417184 RepID=A0A9W8A588_9FUNG|nr:Cell cycle serine/threonine-protein kinase cdc5/MSD2 [Mycoemilia scoparia]